MKKSPLMLVEVKNPIRQERRQPASAPLLKKAEAKTRTGVAYPLSACCCGFPAWQEESQDV